jgi:hypothetical protein
MNDTTYHLVGLGPSNYDLRSPEALAKYGIEVVGYDDLGRPVKKYPKEYDLRYILYARASDDYYARWIDPTKTVERNSAGAQAVVTKAAAEEVSQASLQAMRERLVSSQAPQGAAQAPAEAPQVPVEAPAAVAEAPVPPAAPSPPQAPPATNGASVPGDINFE